ncbi:MAG: glucosamine--fructose-6-phosphate aminotransferase [Gammaproteobacteria bacterium]|jgi:hypothetical protein
MGTEDATCSIPGFGHAVAAWGSDAFDAALKQDFERLEPGLLPLKEATGQGGLVDAGRLDVTVLSVGGDEGTIRARVGVFFEETVGGCSCGDDPVSYPVYCELAITIDKSTGEGQFTPS